MSRAAPSAIFALDLLQDVNNLRPLIFMAARDHAFRTSLLVSGRFAARDVTGVWRREVDAICAETGAQLHIFEGSWDGHQKLAGEGMLFAASESNLPNHSTIYNLFQHAPASFLKVTLQHGFECPGFRHSAEHDRAHGTTASFQADLLCTWTDPGRLPALAPSQRAKVYVTGPTSVLQLKQGQASVAAPKPGLVCENLHSVRLGGDGEIRAEFVHVFTSFVSTMSEAERKVVLRPHPGGQFSLREGFALPAGVSIENAPLYRVSLTDYAFLISAPSSALIDGLLAGIPTAVWQDRGSRIDAANYDGLTMVSSVEEWVCFAAAAARDPSTFIARQEEFLDRQGIVRDPRIVYNRFSALFAAAGRRWGGGDAPL